MQQQQCFIGQTEKAGRRRGRVWIGPLLALVWAGGCLDRPIGSPSPETTNVFVDRIKQNAVDKIDLLFMIDNSASMSDKQAILRLAVPDLVERLVNPVCVDAQGARGETPAPGAPCPSGQTREFEAIENINVAVVSSSLGDAGAQTTCVGTGAGGAPDQIDMAHLIGSTSRGNIPGATDTGFLEWRAGSTDSSSFSSQFERMVGSVGEKGCGLEASLESWYRFLVDPAPYRELVRVRCGGSKSDALNCVQASTDASGQLLLDEELLQQRAAFLRPDSLVAIIMLSDENDCSIAPGGQTFIVADTSRRMNSASSVCATDPSSACCYMCGGRVPDGCSADPVCAEAPETGVAAGRLTATDDGVNLRCFDQKRRFGYDFLYPTARYVNALAQRELCLSHLDLSLANCPEGGLVPNPLYAGSRDPSLVFLGGIVGVPWQTLASDVDASGLPITSPDTTLRFKTAAQLSADGTWAQIVGSPGVPPSSPYMVESQFPRTGVSVGNALNGREYDTVDTGLPGEPPSDLEYACIFELSEPRDCDQRDPRTEQCDCYDGNFDRPLCEREPGDGNPGSTQYWAKAYPGLRQLEVLRAYGDNSIVASICARNVDIATQDSRQDFGYRPAVDSIVERLKERLADRCLPRGLLTADDGSVPCTLVEAQPQPTGACECDPAIARRVPDDRTDALIRGELASTPGAPCGADDPSCNGACLCEVLQVTQAANPDPEEALRTCREDEDASGVEGWCYVANTSDQQIGNPELVADCPATGRQLLRFVGQGLARNSTTFVACQGSSLAAQRND
jgi:hypothetical protein